MAITDVEKLASQLADAKMLNTDISVKELLKIDGVGSVDRASKVASYAVAWDHYVVVCGLDPGRVVELPAIAQSVQKSFGE